MLFMTYFDHITDILRANISTKLYKYYNYIILCVILIDISFIQLFVTRITFIYFCENYYHTLNFNCD